MNNITKLVIVLLLIASIGAVVALKKSEEKQLPASGLIADLPDLPLLPGETVAEAGPITLAPAALPRLVDLGKATCAPCKAMAPILEGLKTDYVGRLIVDVINFDKQPEAKKQFPIQIYPTQIFFDLSGKEMYRHTGIFSREDILAKWKELGFDLDQASEKKV